MKNTHPFLRFFVFPCLSLFFPFKAVFAEVSTVQKIENALQKVDGLEFKHCPRFESKKFFFVTPKNDEDRRKLESRFVSTVGKQAPAGALKGGFSLRLSEQESQTPFSVLLDVFLLDTAEQVKLSHMAIQMKATQFNPAYLPHYRIFGGSSAIGLIVRPHPDEFRALPRKGVNDLCLDEIQAHYGKLLTSLSSEPLPVNAGSGKFADFLSGKRFDSGVINSLDDEAMKELSLHPDINALALSSSRLSKATYDRLGDLKQLESLSLGPDKIGDSGIMSLSQLENLRVLRLGYCRISDNGLSSLKPLIHLRELSLRGNQISGAGLANLSGMSELKDLGLNWNPISDSGLEKLPVLPRLQTLMLTDSFVTEKGIAHLSKQPALRYLVLRRSQVGDGIFATLKEMKSLGAVDLLFTKVSEKAVQEFRALRPEVIVMTENSPQSEEKRLSEFESSLHQE